jgi:hypothetical protein
LSNSDECEKEEHSDHNSLVNHFQTKSSEWWTHRKNNFFILRFVGQIWNFKKLRTNLQIMKFLWTSLQNWNMFRDQFSFFFNKKIILIILIGSEWDNSDGEAWGSYGVVIDFWYSGGDTWKNKIVFQC